MPDLPSYGTGAVAPYASGLPSGSSSWSSFGSSGGSGSDGGSGFDWSGLGKVAAPFVASIFGPSNPYEKDTLDTANTLKGLGAADKATGSAALAPVLAYLKAIAGGDPTAIQEATAPQRAKIIDQYDTAKKAITQQPRGGGQASAALSLEGKKASDLATTASSARTAGVQQLGSLGESIFNTGAQEQTSGLESALKAFQGLSQDKQKTNAGFGAAIGAALPFIFGLF
jgi:hypothetical protein